MKNRQFVWFPIAVLMSLTLAGCGGNDSPAPVAQGTSSDTTGTTPPPGAPSDGSGTTTITTSNLECGPVYPQGDTVKLHTCTQATSQSLAVDNGLYMCTYGPATLEGVALTQ